MSNDGGLVPVSQSAEQQSNARKVVRIRDASSLLIIDRQSKMPKVLMGRRNKQLVFMPDKYVFPGGRSDNEDGSVTSANELNKADQEKLLAGMGSKASKRRAKALALCAIRETFEETGLKLATAFSSPLTSAGNSNVVTANHPGWEQFMQGGSIPDLENLRYFARAVTPPAFSRRFDTRFFIIFRDQINSGFDQTLISCGELEDLGWISLEKAATLNIADITSRILNDAQILLTDTDCYLPASLPVVQYLTCYGRLTREVI